MARIGMRQGLVQGVRQEMQLLPRMLQSIEVLQLPGAELEAFLLDAVQSNEALRLAEPVGPGAVSGHVASSGPRGGGAEARDRHDAWLENQAAPEGGLTEHLEAQVALLDLGPSAAAWVGFVIRALDPSGYLTATDEMLMSWAADEGLAGDEGCLGRAIAVVQSLEPRGIGGRDAVESLLLQLDPREPDYDLTCRLLEEFLDEVAKNKLPSVAKSLGVDIEQLHELLGRLKELRLAPAGGLGGVDSPSIRPDVIVERHGDGFQVRIDDSGLPPVEIDGSVERLARDKAQASEVRTYLRERLNQARWLVDAVAERKRTLQRVATWVFHAQRRFLEEGPAALVPLSMTEVAEGLDLAVSTVSRAVAEKYADTPWGFVALRSLFPVSAGANEGAVRDSVGDALKKVVDEEDPERPFSDDELAARLSEAGYEVARRTVAKYRRELGIPSSYRRRRW